MPQLVAQNAALLASRQVAGEAVASAAIAVIVETTMTASHVPCIRRPARVVGTKLLSRSNRAMIAPFIAAIAISPNHGAPSIAAAIVADRAGKRHVPDNC